MTPWRFSPWRGPLVAVRRSGKSGIEAAAPGGHRRARLGRLFQHGPELGQRLCPQLPEGIRIDLIDDADFSMFALGTTVLVPEARELLGVIAAEISVDGGAEIGGRGQIILRGHTDALKWRSGAPVNNWSLSSGRAEATRQELLRRGLPEARFERIEGVAEREPLVPNDPADPRNRRISILLVG